MKKLIYNKHQNEYISNELINKYMYYKYEKSDSYCYYIFSIKDIDNIQSDGITYNTNKCYLMYVPKNPNNNAFLYDTNNKVNVLFKNELYEISFSEFVNTFMVFFKYDSKPVHELPDKLIQDIPD